MLVQSQKSFSDKAACSTEDALQRNNMGLFGRVPSLENGEDEFEEARRNWGRAIWFFTVRRFKDSSL